VSTEGKNSLPHGTRTPVQRLLIVRLSSMGDIIHTLPAATALRNAFPEATIGWIVEERWAELLCALHTPRFGLRSPQRPLLDRLHTVNTKKWRSSLLSTHTWHQIASEISELRGGRYEVAVDLQGAVRSALLARWSKAPVLYGARQSRENVASMFYTHQVITRGAHIIEQNISIAEAVVGKPLQVPAARFPCDPGAEEECERRLQSDGISDFALLNPGAGWGAKQWPAERYGEVAKGLAQYGMRSLVNVGPGEESLARAVEAASEGSARGITCSVTQLIALTRRARLFVGGDTGPMHLAAALAVPVVAIFGPTNPARNGPFSNNCVVLRNASSQTSHARLPEPEQGLLEITPEEVLGAARNLLRSCGV
jgi:heptosyltransferase-1